MAWELCSCRSIWPRKYFVISKKRLCPSSAIFVCLIASLLYIFFQFWSLSLGLPCSDFFSKFPWEFRQFALPRELWDCAPFHRRHLWGRFLAADWLGVLCGRFRRLSIAPRSSRNCSAPEKCWRPAGKSEGFSYLHIPTLFQLLIGQRLMSVDFW